MTDLAAITPHLRKQEAVLWSGRPFAPASLSAYRGWHTWVGRIFVFIAMVMGLIAWSNRAEIDSVWIPVGLVGVPLVIGLAFGIGLSWIMRDARQQLHYAITGQRVLVVTKNGPISFPVTKDSKIAHNKGRQGVDTVQFMQGRQIDLQARRANNTFVQRQVYSQAKIFTLPSDEAADAFRALQTLKAKAR